MLRPYLKIWDWDWIFSRAVRVISSLCIRSPWFWPSKQFLCTTCSELVFFSYWTCSLMNILLSYYGLTDVHCVRGQSGFFDLALTEVNMQIEFDWKLSVYSLGLDIWLLSFKSKSGLMGWPPQPPRERVLKINKIVGFWWSISHWETRIGIFGAVIDGIIKLSNFFCEMRLLRSLRPLRLLRLLRSLRPQIFQGLENHYWALQSHPGCWI